MCSVRVPCAYVQRERKRETETQKLKVVTSGEKDQEARVDRRLTFHCSFLYCLNFFLIKKNLKTRSEKVKKRKNFKKSFAYSLFIRTFKRVFSMFHVIQMHWKETWSVCVGWQQGRGTEDAQESVQGTVARF